MIPKEQQVTSWSWSRELDKRGIGFDSVWYWVDGKIVNEALLDSCMESFPYERRNTGIEGIPAPSIAELLEKMPECLKNWAPLSQLTILKIKYIYRVCYVEKGFGVVAYNGKRLVWEANKLSDALAEMTCWLKDNGYLK